jgi:glutaredoxin-related protein
MQFPNTELPLVKNSWRSLTGGKSTIRWATGVEVFMGRADRDPVATVVVYRVKGEAEKMHKVRVPDWTDPALNAPFGEGHRVLLTGSSSKLLSREIATQLRGRTITQELFPFSFREVLKLNGIEVSAHYTESEEARIRGLLRRYLEWGGFPEIWVKEEFAADTLREYVSVMLFRDLVERFEIRNYKALKLFLKLAVTSFSTRMSINRTANYMRSVGVGVSRNTLYNTPNSHPMRLSKCSKFKSLSKTIHDYPLSSHKLFLHTFVEPLFLIYRFELYKTYLLHLYLLQKSYYDLVLMYLLLCMLELHPLSLELALEV